MIKSLRTFAAVVCGLLALPLLAADLPSGYGEVDYIRAGGNQWINTDYIFNYATNMEVEVDVALDTTGQCSIFYSRNSSPFRGVEILMTAYQQIRCTFGDSGNITVSSKKYVPYNRRLYKFKNGAFYLDGVLVTNLTATAYNMNQHLQLFSNYSGTQYGDKASGKLYGARAWIDKNGTREQVMDLVPATNSTGVAGMYDVVRDRFFTSGSGTDFIAPTGETIYSVKNDENTSINQGTIWADGAAPVAGKNYIVTNQVVLVGATGNPPPQYKPNFFPGDSLQLGEVGGNAARYNVKQSQYSCVPNLILANGTFYARGGFIAGGISTVISKSDAPFKVSEGWQNLTLTAGHEFRGAEDTMLLIGQQSNNGSKYKLTIEDGSPQYYGKWKGTGISRVVLGSPAALGGERETFAADALYLTGSVPGTPDDLTINADSHYIFTFDFDGKMPSRGRGITLSRPNRMLELVVPPGRTVRCDMPVVVNDQPSKPNYVMIHNDTTLGTEGETSRFSLGDWNGGRLMVSNVAVRISNIGASTATTLAVSNNAAFWAEVDSTNGCFYSQISANTTLETAEDKIKILLDYANTVEVDGEQVVKEAVEIPVLKIDTSVRTVTPSDFVLADGSTKFTKGSQKFAVRTEGTTQTVYWVTDSAGLILIFR